MNAVILVLGIIVLAYATYEDVKYRGVTPLPLFLYSALVLVYKIYTRDFIYAWVLLVSGGLFLLISRVFKAHDGEAWLPEGDAWLLIAAMAFAQSFKNYLLLWMFLAISEFLMRVGMFLRHRSIAKAFDVRAPFAPPVLIAAIQSLILCTCEVIK